jgi:hypothetical protein
VDLEKKTHQSNGCLKGYPNFGGSCGYSLAFQVVVFELMLACSFSFFQNGLEPWPQTGFFFLKLLGTTQGIIIIIIIINSKVVG